MSSVTSKSNWIEIRPATQADIPVVVSLERKCSAAPHWNEEQYEKALVPEDNRLFLIAARSTAVSPANGRPEIGAMTFMAHEILGFLIASNTAPDWELESIAIAPESRNIGIGKRLLTAFLVKAKETNSQGVFLEVRESNLAARRLYEKAGFRETGRRKSYYINPIEDAILYGVRFSG